MCGRPLEAALGHSCSGGQQLRASQFSDPHHKPNQGMEIKGGKIKIEKAKQKQKAGKGGLQGVAGGEDAQGGGF